VNTPTVDTAAQTQTFEALESAARQTVVAELTANAPLPTNTTEPTATLEPTTAPASPTAAATSAVIATNTAAPALATQTVVRPTATPTNTLCKIVSQSPAFGQTVKPREDLDFRWTVQNISTRTWAQAETDFRYLSGEKMVRADAVDFPKTVAANEQVDLIVDVLAPTLPGRYTTTWIIVNGSQTVCTLTATITVAQ
jgi:hypothetical protein